MTRKERLQAEVSTLGLSTAGTMQQIQARIDAALEAAEDTATAAYTPPATPSLQQRRKAGVLLTSALSAATHTG